MALAARGAREVEGGTESIGDAAVADALRKRAVSVYARTGIAVLATIGVLVASRQLLGL